MPFSSSAESSRAAPGRGRPMQPTRHCHCAFSCPFRSSDMSSPASEQRALAYTHSGCDPVASGRGGQMEGSRERDSRHSIAIYQLQYKILSGACSCCCGLHLGGPKASKHPILCCHTKHYKTRSAEPHGAKWSLSLQLPSDGITDNIAHKPH